MKKLHFILMTLLLLSCEKKIDYKVNEWFADGSQNTRFLFMFVEVNDLDSKNLIEASIELKKQYLLDSIDLDGSGVSMIHFFLNKDRIEVPENLIPQLSRKYNNEKIAQELNYIKKGVISIGYAGRDILQKDTIFVSELFVPKIGRSAKEIFAKNKRNPEGN